MHHPFLNTGETFALTQSSDRSPLSTDFWNIANSPGANCEAQFFRIALDIVSGPTDFETSIFFKRLSFLYPATLKSAGYYVIPSVQKFAFECPSVRPYVRPFPLSILSIFRPIFFKLCIRVDIRKEWFGIVDG